MDRRTFLRLGGMTAAGALVAGCRSKNEKLIPYLVPPEDGVTPGRADYYASSCRFCPAGCGILVRVSEGRAKKIEGNPAHPVNRGRLCARGQAVLQELYNPDRITQPLKRSGPRGSGMFTKVSWKEGLALVTGNLTSLQKGRETDRLALLTPRLRGTMAELAKSFMGAFGSPHHVSHELLAPEWLNKATGMSFGRPGLPFYDMGETRYLISFGADFVEGHLSPVQYGEAFGRMRQGRDTVRGHFTYVGGRMSLTCASADRWLPARPGSEGELALAMARLILVESLYDADSLADNGLTPATLLKRLEPHTVLRAAELTGLTGEAITEVAREFATTRPALAVVGDSVAFQSNGLESVRAVQLLNVLAGSLNRPGGLYPAGAPFEGEGEAFSGLLSLIEEMGKNRIRTALIQGDPIHTVPRAAGFREALARVPFIVSFSQLLDDTALQADLVLPDNSALESWGDVVPLSGTRERVIGLMQPVVTPLLDTRQFPDVLIAVAGELGGKTAAALPYGSYLDMLKEGMKERIGHGEGADFEAVWTELLSRGGLFETRGKEEKGFSWSQKAPLPVPSAPRFAGDDKEFPLHLQVYPSTAFYDGRGAALPWLQQLPDPMTTVVWDSWVEINPRTAADLGIGFGDLVEVASVQGTIRLPCVIYPGIRPDMAAIPLGQGHREMGRYARGRGVNPLDLLAVHFQGEGPLPAWNATRVRVTRISAEGGLVTAGHPQGSYRSDLIGV